MGLWERFKLLFKVKTSSALDDMENPVEVLDYAYNQQEEFLQTVKRGLVDVATAKQQLQQQTNKMDAKIPKLELQARNAVAADREDLARIALNRKQIALVELEGLENQLAELELEEQRMIAAEQEISQRVSSFRTQRQAMVARYSAAEAQVRTREAFSGVSGELGELSMALGRAEEKTDRMLAKASALDALMAGGSLEMTVGPGNDMVENELRKLAASTAVEQELAGLKSSYSAPRLAVPEETESALEIKRIVIDAPNND